MRQQRLLQPCSSLLNRNRQYIYRGEREMIKLGAFATINAINPVRSGETPDTRPIEPTRKEGASIIGVAQTVNSGYSSPVAGNTGATRTLRLKELAP